MVDLFELFVDGIIARNQGDGWEHEVKQHQTYHVGDIIPVRKKSDTVTKVFKTAVHQSTGSL